MKNNEVEISMIVPIYNVEKYLKECLDSITEQTYQNFEVILVDDGSTDSSGKIADEYQERYKYISVIHKVNGGLSSARNEGIKHAAGKYLCFVDSDDLIDKNYLKYMIESAKKNDADCVFSDYVEVDESGDKIEKDYGKNPYQEGLQDWQKVMEKLTIIGECHYATTAVVMWNKLIRTAIMKRFEFKEGVLHEDEFMIMPLLLSCNRITWVSEKLYLYRHRANSIMCNKEIVWKHFDVMDAYETRICLCEENKLGHLLQRFTNSYFENVIIRYSLYEKEIVNAKKKNDFRKRILAGIVKYRNYLGTRKKLKYLIFVISPKIYLKKIY